MLLNTEIKHFHLPSLLQICFWVANWGDIFHLGWHLDIDCVWDWILFRCKLWWWRRWLEREEKGNCVFGNLNGIFEVYFGYKSFVTIFPAHFSLWSRSIFVFTNSVLSSIFYSEFRFMVEWNFIHRHGWIHLHSPVAGKLICSRFIGYFMHYKHSF